MGGIPVLYLYDVPAAADLEHEFALIGAFLTQWNNGAAVRISHRSHGLTEAPRGLADAKALGHQRFAAQCSCKPCGRCLCHVR